MSYNGQMDRQIERLRRLVRARWIVVPIVIVLGMVGTVMVNGGLIKLTEPIFLAMAVLGYNLAFHLTIPRLGSARSLTIHSWLQILFDLVVIAAVIHFSGSTSPLALLYLLNIISAGFVLPPGGSYVVASLSSLMYGLLLVGEYTGLLAPAYSFYPNGKAIIPDQQAIWAGYFLTVTGLLYASAFLTDYLAGQVHAGEERVRQQLAELRAVLESTGDVIVVTDRQGVTLLFNRAAERTFDVTAGQVIGQPLPETVPPLAELMNEVLHSPEAQTHDCEVALPDKRMLVCDFQPLRAADSTLHGWVGALHDVSHFKELDRIKSEMVATVSHDLRGPLHLTRGYFDALVESLGPFTDDKQILVNTVRRSLNRIEALVTNLLDLEKIEAGVGMSWERCDLGLLIADAIADLEMSAADKGVTLSAEMPLTLPLVWGDPCWLAQVFQNLLDNAVKFTRPGDSVAVRAGLEAATVVVTVADTGPGISADDLQHIFDRFYQGKHQMLGRARSAGLGLAIVKSIVEHHSGRVWAESQVGQGSTFYVALPIASTDTPTIKPVTGDGGQ